MAVAERPLRKDAERNRQRIIEAATELFAERGLGVTLNDVAHYAGVGVGTVYRRYPDKADLIEEVFEHRLGELAVLAEVARDDPDPWNGLTNFLERSLELQARDRGFMELALRSPESLQRVGQLRASIWPIVGDLLDRAREAGKLRADFVLPDGPMIVLMIGTVIDCARDVQPDLWRRYLAMMIQGLRADPGKPDPLPVHPLPAERVDEILAAWKPPRR
jgi:AcrR family transcriptional regulator